MLDEHLSRFVFVVHIVVRFRQVLKLGSTYNRKLALLLDALAVSHQGLHHGEADKNAQGKRNRRQRRHAYLELPVHVAEHRRSMALVVLRFLNQLVGALGYFAGNLRPAVLVILIEHQLTGTIHLFVCRQKGIVDGKLYVLYLVRPRGNARLVRLAYQAHGVFFGRH